MASESAIPAPASKWADAEKIALLVSVIKATGTTKIKWADVSVPAGRTTQSSAKIYAELLKASAAVPMTVGADITPSKKRGRKSNDDGAATPTEKKKSVRKPKTAERVATGSPVEDDEESPNKKVKVEARDENEDEDDVFGESEAA